MSHSTSSRAGRLLCTLLLALFAALPLLAGNSKITGRVLSGQTGEALPGANVVITHTILSGGQQVQVDHPMGAATDPDGYYFIMNVPPGVYVIKASMVGYAPETQRLVRVESDRTITVDFRLVSSDVQLSDVVVTAQRDIVRPDVSTTQEVISTTRIEQMPVLRLDEFVGRIKGVTLVSGAEGNGLSIRGGSIRETDVRLDGISLQDPRTDNSYLALNSTTVQEVQVLTGGFEAKYGGIRSGLLNVVTKEGQRERYTASIKADVAPAHQKRFFGTNPWSDQSWIYRVYAGQYAMGGIKPGDSTVVPADVRKYFENFKGWRDRTTQDNSLDSTQKLALWNLQHPQYDIAPKPDIYLEGSITGPFPGAGIPVLGDFAERTTFLAGFKYEDSQLAFPIGPRNDYLDWNGQLKLTTMLQDNMKLSINGMYASIKTSSGGQRTSYAGALIDQNSSFSFLNSTTSSVEAQARLLNGESISQLFNRSRLQYFDQRYIIGGAKFTHTLANNAYYTIDFQIGYTDQQLQPFSMDSRDSSLYASFYSALRRQTRYYNLPQFGSPNASTNFGYDPLGAFAIYGGAQRVDSSYSWVGQLKGDLTLQLGRHNQVEAGFSARLQNLFVYSGTWFQSELSFTPDTWEYYRVHPLEMGLYAQDKLEFEGMVLNAGLRLDYFNPMKKGYQTGFPLSEAYQTLYNDTYQNLPGGAGSFERWLFFRDLLSEPKGWPETANRVQVYLSPRLGVSFPITESSKMYFNYGHFYQRPPISFLYNLQLYPGSVGVPTPDLDMARTVSYEFGYEQMFLNDFLVNITAYYKDVRGEPLSRMYINYYDDNLVSRYYPDKYSDTRGVEARIERPMGRFVTFSAMFDYMLTSSGESGLAQVFEDRLKAKDSESRSPNIAVTEPRPRANINLNLHTPEDFGPELFGINWLGSIYANFFFEWQDGGRVLLNSDESNVSLRQYVDVVNRWNIDFRGSKAFNTPYGSLEFVITVQNLTNNKWLNTSNMSQKQLGDYKASLLTPNKGGSDQWGQYKSDDNHINTGWWDAPLFLNPRRIVLGLRLNI